jgi:fructose-1,6-bisphosphatase I
MTIERHINEQEHLHPSATGEFTALLRDLTVAIKHITRDVRRAGLNEILGHTGDENVHGERVKKLDMYANDAIQQAMEHGGHLCAMASEEWDNMEQIPNKFKKGKYVLLFDPLDGSSNIDINVTVGTIFSIYRRITPDTFGDAQLEDILQPGYLQVASGYACYGSSTILVLTTGNGVNMFTYDPTIGEFFLIHENVKIPQDSSYYSVNEGNFNRWSPEIQEFVTNLKQPADKNQKPFKMRYIGTAVADIHRTLLYGGIFMYPYDTISKKNKLRLLYEANPLAMIVEQAGGKASNGHQRIMDLRPTEIHERTALYIGSTALVEQVEKALAKQE